MPSVVIRNWITDRNLCCKFPMASLLAFRCAGFNLNYIWFHFMAHLIYQLPFAMCFFMLSGFLQIDITKHWIFGLISDAQIFPGSTRISGLLNTLLVPIIITIIGYFSGLRNLPFWTVGQLQPLQTPLSFLSTRFLCSVIILLAYRLGSKVRCPMVPAPCLLSDFESIHQQMLVSRFHDPREVVFHHVVFRYVALMLLSQNFFDGFFLTLWFDLLVGSKLAAVLSSLPSQLLRWVSFCQRSQLFYRMHSTRNLVVSYIFAGQLFLHAFWRILWPVTLQTHCYDPI